VKKRKSEKGGDINCQVCTRKKVRRLLVGQRKHHLAEGTGSLGGQKEKWIKEKVKKGQHRGHVVQKSATEWRAHFVGKPVESSIRCKREEGKKVKSKK